MYQQKRTNILTQYGFPIKSDLQYNESTVTKFRARANNYKSTHRNFRKEQILSNQARNQRLFHERYLQNDHKRICDWKITIIDNAETV